MATHLDYWKESHLVNQKEWHLVNQMAWHLDFLKESLRESH
jgi:hypothetical protein